VIPIVAPVLQPFNLDKTAYFTGDTFVQPEGYPSLYVVDLYAEGKIGPFDINLLPVELQALITDPVRLSKRRCPTCG
jgi:hypothetical protein